MRALPALLLCLPLLATAQAPSTAEFDRLRQALARLEQDNQRLQAENRQLAEEVTRLRRGAENARIIDARNRRLEQRTVELERALQLTRQENDALRDRSNQQWFLRGAGVLLVGLLLGMILPRLRPRRTSRWGDL